MEKWEKTYLQISTCLTSMFKCFLAEAESKLLLMLQKKKGLELFRYCSKTLFVHTPVLIFQQVSCTARDGQYELVEDIIYKVLYTHLYLYTSQT